VNYHFNLPFEESQM